ncbi:EI24 domain-containing protein [Kitasatospora azatica]|uniref:EI24 domain-containing protein n=1 Tax=Kitasatospora azatica TaxID=58347 RepID=UPI000A56D0E2
MARNPRWWAFGLLPALLAMVLVGVALGALLWWLGDLVNWATPFAEHWSPAWRRTFRDLLSALVLGGGVLLAVVAFTGLTLAIGQPFYERLVREVTPPPADAPQIGILDSLVDGVKVGLRAAGCGVGLFLLGCVPVLGQLLAPVLGVLVAGYFLTVELTATAFELRGVPPRERLRGRRMLAIGFGVPLVLAFLVPFATVLLMPGAVAGAALLVAAEDEPDPADEPEQGRPPVEPEAVRHVAAQA